MKQGMAETTLQRYLRLWEYRQIGQYGIYTSIDMKHGVWLQIYTIWSDSYPHITLFNLDELLGPFNYPELERINNGL